MKRAIVAGVILLAAVTLAGCSAGDDAKRTNIDGGYLVAVDVELPDGRTVVCVTSTARISCDWDNAN